MINILKSKSLKKLFIICGILLKVSLQLAIAATETLLSADTLDDKPSGVALILPLFLLAP